VQQPVNFRICQLVYKCLHQLAPLYLTMMIIPVSAISVHRRLRSANLSALVTPRTRTVGFSPRSFSAAGLSSWNCLLSELKKTSLTIEAFSGVVANTPRTSIAAASIKPRYCTLPLQCSGAGLSHDRSTNQRAAARLLPARICYKSGPRRRGIQISLAMTPRRISILKIRKTHIKSPKAMTGHQLVPDGTR